MIALLAAAVLGATAAEDDDSAYEQTLVKWGLEQHQAVVETEPEGKTIDAVLTAREDVFAESDPVPTWLNVFHGRTREHVVLREVLLKKGDPFTKAKADETERNLRALIIFAVAKVVPVKSPFGGVIVLVITKDRWSFRANWDYSVVGSVLERLHVPITEVNLLGQGIEVTLDPNLRRDTLAIGEEIVWRRFLDSRFLLREQFNLIFSRVSGKLEGSSGLAQVARPLVSLDQKWSFNTYGVWDIRRVRLFRGRTVWELGYPDDVMPTATVPYVYDRREIDVAAIGTRQLGSRWINRLSAGLAGYVHQYAPPPESMLTPDMAAWFISTKIPRSEDATYLYAGWNLFLAQYVQRHDIEAYGLTEDFQVGPSLIVEAKYAAPIVTKTHFIELGAALRWRFLFGEDMLVLRGAAAARFQLGGPVVNEHYAFEISNWSPPFEGGRFVTRVLAELRAHDLDNNVIVLDAGQGLRGAPSGSFAGRNLLLGNFEYRTRTFAITTLLAGFVFFYDVGTAFDTRPSFTHTIGAGLRIMIPQLNSVAIRLDVGFIIGAPAGELSSTFGQVTQLRPAFFDSPL